MEDTKPDAQEVLETPETVTETAPDSETSDDSAARLAALEQEKADLEAKNKQLYERAKKAEQKAKEETPAAPSQPFSPKDYLALNQAGITADDFDEVVRVAKILDKTIAEALQDSTLKTILETRKEERRTAQATQTKSPRGTSKPTGEALIERASKGQLPESDADIAALVAAEMEAKKKK